MAARKKTDHPHIALVDEVYNLGLKPETTAERVRRLQAEARVLAAEEVEVFARMLDGVIAKAAEISTGGVAYHVGVREIADRLKSDPEAKTLTIRALAEREA